LLEECERMLHLRLQALGLPVDICPCSILHSAQPLAPSLLARPLLCRQTIREKFSRCSPHRGHPTILPLGRQFTPSYTLPDTRHHNPTFTPLTPIHHPGIA